MKLSELNDWLTLGANLGVLAGILFLALELRQNSEMLESQARSVRQEIRLTDYVLPLNNETYARALVKYRNNEQLTEYEDLLVRRGMDVTLTNFQYVFNEYLNGLIDESELPVNVWSNAFHRGGRSNADYWPDLSDYWEEMKSINYDPVFVTWMDENVVNRSNQESIVMNRDAIAAANETLGAIGAVATPTYLRFQLKQNTNAL